MRKIVTFFAALACVAAFITAAVAAVPLSYDLSPPGPTSKAPFGFVTGVAVGGSSLMGDTMLSVPLQSGITAPPAVGTLRSFRWAGGVTDAFAAKFSVSKGNENLIKQFLSAPKSTSMDEHVTIYAFNELKKSWYLAFDCTVNGIIKHDGDVLDLKVDGGVVDSQVVPGAGSTSTCKVNDGSGPMIKPLGVKVPET